MKTLPTQNSNVARIVIDGQEITTKWVYVTPNVAKEFKARMGKNRNPMASITRKYARDRLSGNWYTTHQGIAFNADGELIDGQHRLESIIDSGVPCYMLVTTGIAREAMKAMDKGAVRTAAHSLQIVGHALGSSRAVAIARRMIVGTGGNRSYQISDMLLMEFIDLNFDAIDFTITHVIERHCPAVVAGCIARAYWHYDSIDLARFCQALCDKVPFNETEERDRAPALLRQAVALSRGKTGAHFAKLALYNKTQEAIKDWMAGKAKSELRGRIKEDLFPLPKERTLEIDQATFADLRQERLEKHQMHKQARSAREAQQQEAQGGIGS